MIYALYYPGRPSFRPIGVTVDGITSPIESCTVVGGPWPATAEGIDALGDFVSRAYGTTAAEYAVEEATAKTTEGQRIRSANPAA